MFAAEIPPPERVLRFNRRFSMAGKSAQIANAVSGGMPLTERDLRVAEAYGHSRDRIWPSEGTPGGELF
jgi:hypothetical protein